MLHKISANYDLSFGDKDLIKENNQNRLSVKRRLIISRQTRNESIQKLS